MIGIWPSLTWLALSILGIGLAWGDGTLKFSSISAFGIMGAILYWGGFFDPLLRSASN